jgi:hypothetical protein
MNPIQYHLLLTIHLWCGANPNQYTIDSQLRAIWAAHIPGLPYEPNGIQRFMFQMYQDALFGPCAAAHGMTPGEFVTGGERQILPGLGLSSQRKEHVTASRLQRNPRLKLGRFSPEFVALLKRIIFAGLPWLLCSNLGLMGQDQGSIQVSQLQGPAYARLLNLDFGKLAADKSAHWFLQQNASGQTLSNYSVYVVLNPDSSSMQLSDVSHDLALRVSCALCAVALLPLSSTECVDLSCHCVCSSLIVCARH